MLKGFAVAVAVAAITTINSFNILKFSLSPHRMTKQGSHNLLLRIIIINIIRRDINIIVFFSGTMHQLFFELQYF